MNSEYLSPRQKAAALWAEHVAKNTAKDRDDVFEIVAEQFDDSELVELTMVCSWRNMRTRLHDSLHLDQEPAEYKGPGLTPKANPDSVKEYLKKILEDWPDEMPVPNPD